MTDATAAAKRLMMLAAAPDADGRALLALLAADFRTATALTQLGAALAYGIAGKPPFHDIRPLNDTRRVAAFVTDAARDDGPDAAHDLLADFNPRDLAIVVRVLLAMWRQACAEAMRTVLAAAYASDWLSEAPLTPEHPQPGPHIQTDEKQPRTGRKPDGQQ